MPFEKTYHVSWAHLDSNGHMANTAYLDIAVDARFMYFTQCGFPPAEFARLRIGPGVPRDEGDYYRELHMLQATRGHFMLAGASHDASRIPIGNKGRRRGEEHSAAVTVQDRGVGPG